jgi:hypothetical protein
MTQLARELGSSFRGVLGGPSDSDAVSACLRSCRRTESRYDTVLGTELSPRMRDVITTQRRQLVEDDAALLAIQF